MKEDVGSVAVCVVATGMIAAEEITLYTDDETALGKYATLEFLYTRHNSYYISTCVTIII